MSNTSLLPASRLTSAFKLFRVAAFAEAASWTGLLIGMVFKYLVVKDEIGVKIFGPIHGVCFVLYVLSVLLNRPLTSWTVKNTLLGLLASIPPLCTLIFERWAVRRIGNEGSGGRAA